MYRHYESTEQIILEIVIAFFDRQKSDVCEKIEKRVPAAVILEELLIKFYCSNLLIFLSFFVKIRKDGGQHVCWLEANHFEREKGITDGKKNWNGIERHTLPDHQTGR